LLVALAVVLWHLSQPGSASAQVPWALAAWMPGPAPTPTPSGGALGQPPVPADLPANVRAFVRLALPYALEAHAALGWQTSVILAQWGVEHGWHVPDAQGYNWGNTEYAPGCPKPGRFCDAPTPAEGLREYLYTARLPFYDGVRAAVPRGADATAVALGESPWDEATIRPTDIPAMRSWRFCASSISIGLTTPETASWPPETSKQPGLEECTRGGPLCSLEPVSSPHPVERNPLDVYRITPLPCASCS
jgi:hypothetical protein